MSKRALLLGFLGALFLCGFTFFNDMVIRGSFLVGSFLPFSILGTLMLFVLFVNPLLGRVSRRLVLTGRELAVVTGLSLFVCFIPGRGLMHHFTNVLMMPHHFVRTDQSWRSDDVRLHLDKVSDWRLLTSRLREGAPEGTALSLLRAHLPAELVAEATSGGEVPSVPVQGRLIAALNALIENGELWEPASRLELPTYARHLLRRGERMTDAERSSVVRALVDVALEGAVKPRHPSMVDLVSPMMLAEPWLDARALDGFVSGVGEGEKDISLTRDIPWVAWRTPLLFWLPVILFMCLAGVGLSLVLHRQWASHEHLPYPTVELTRMLLPEEGRASCTLFRSKLFWVGLVPIFLIYMNNFACVWWPEYMIPVQLRLYFGPFVKLVPTYYRSGIGWWTIFNPLLIFTVIGFAYFLPKDVSLSLGLAPFIFGYVTGTLNSYGVALGPAMTRPSIHTFCYGGAYVAMFLVILYTGRRYYGSVLRRRLGIRRGGDPVEPFAVWGARAMLLGIAGFVVATTMAGLDVPVAILYILALLAILTVVSRLCAEAGVYYLHTNLFPCALLWGFLGEGSLGAQQLLILGMLSCVLFVDPRECFMPYVVESLQLNDRTQGRRLGRLATLGLVAIVLGLLVAIPCTLYFQYKNGAITVGDGWTLYSPPRMAIASNLQLRKTMEAQGSLPLLDNQSLTERISSIRPVPEAMVAFAVTFGLVILFTVCRQRLTWWPLHPVMFLTLATYQSTLMAVSFLIGFAIKHLVTKFGGGKLYQELKPLMCGLICGEFLAGILAMVISVIYYFVTGEPPKPFSIQR